MYLLVGVVAEADATVTEVVTVESVMVVGGA